MSYYSLILQSIIDGEAGNPSINAFTYLTSEVLPTSLGASILADQFINQFLDTGAALIALVHENTNFNLITVTAPQVPTVLHVQAVDFDGTATGDVMPRFVAFEFNCARTVANIRPGKKRVGAISEGMVTNGVLNPTFSSAVNDAAESLGGIFNTTVGGITYTFTPIIVKRVKYTTPGGGEAYRLPNGTDPFAYSLATTWNYQAVSTQNSRKR